MIKIEVKFLLELKLQVATHLFDKIMLSHLHDGDICTCEE